MADQNDLIRRLGAILADRERLENDPEIAFFLLGSFAIRRRLHYLETACHLAAEGARPVGTPGPYSNAPHVASSMLGHNLHLNAALAIDSGAPETVGRKGTWRMPAYAAQPPARYWLDAAVLLDELKRIGSLSSSMPEDRRLPRIFNAISKMASRLDSDLRRGVEHQLAEQAQANDLHTWLREARGSAAPAIRVRLHYDHSHMTGTIHVAGGVELTRQWRLPGDDLFERLQAKRRAIGYHYAPRMISYVAYRMLGIMRRLEEHDRILDELRGTYDWTLAPLLEHPSVQRAIDSLGPTPTLVITTHAALAQLPFAAVHDGEHHLGEVFDIVQATPLGSQSAERLDLMSIGGGAPMGVAPELRVLADTRTLKSAPKEIVFYKDHKAWFRDLEIKDGRKPWDEDTLRWLLSGEDVAILSSHVDPSPFDVAMTHVITPDGRALPLLQAALPSCNLNLLVLAGCLSSGPTDWLHGGTESVIAALRAAGVQSVVSTLWEVEDRAAGLYTECFVADLAAGDSRARAHGNALRAVKAAHHLDRRGAADGKGVHPFFWAPFILTGAWR